MVQSEHISRIVIEYEWSHHPCAALFAVYRELKRKRNFDWPLPPPPQPPPLPPPTPSSPTFFRHNWKSRISIHIYFLAFIFHIEILYIYLLLMIRTNKKQHPEVRYIRKGYHPETGYMGKLLVFIWPRQTTSTWVLLETWTLKHLYIPSYHTQVYKVRISQGLKIANMEWPCLDIVRNFKVLQNQTTATWSAWK